MKRRKLRGKKLLACGVVLGAASVLEACFCATANLVAPPYDAGQDGGVDAGEDQDGGGSDAGVDAGTSDAGMDAGRADAGMGDEDAGPGPTDAVIFFPDGPVANLIAPPDGAF